MTRLVMPVLLLLLSSTAFSQQRLRPISTKQEQLNEEYCSGLFRTAEGIYFDMSDNANLNSVHGYLNILDWLKGRVAGLQVFVTRNNERIAYIRNSRAGIYIDEMPSPASMLNSISIDDIAMIKIIKGPFAGAINSPGGVIAIYTARGEDEEGPE